MNYDVTDLEPKKQNKKNSIQYLLCSNNEGSTNVLYLDKFVMNSRYFNRMGRVSPTGFLVRCTMKIFDSPTFSLGDSKDLSAKH